MFIEKNWKLTIPNESKFKVHWNSRFIWINWQNFVDWQYRLWYERRQTIIHVCILVHKCFQRFWAIGRFNSGIRNRHNFFMWAIFLFEKLGTDSVNYADSGDIKILVWFPGKSILKFAIIFWKCVGGAQMCGCNILKIAQCFILITPVIFICKIRGTYLILA